MPGQFYFARHLDLLDSEFRKHQSRWDALKAKGWEISTPPERESQVGITISREDDQHTVYVVEGSAKSVHNELLRECEAYAGMKKDEYRYVRILVLLAFSALFVILFLYNLMK